MSEQKRERPSSAPSTHGDNSVETAKKAVQGQGEIFGRAVRLHMDASERHERIARAAYQRAHTRGFEPGGELEDWLLAEREIDDAASSR